jgi:hypothetical protein
MEVIMKQITLICFVLALIASNSTWARGYYGGHYGNHYGGNWGSNWGRHYGGGYYGRGGYYNYNGIGLGLGLGLSYGLGYGLGGYYGNNYNSPYYGYPSTAIVTVPATPPVYIQQAAPVAQQYPAGYWYYCNNPQGYYPYIKQCQNDWQQVSPTPPAPR